jgi:hypothetical protein
VPRWLWQEAGDLLAGRRTEATGLGSKRTVLPPDGSLKAFPDKWKSKYIGIHECAGCQAPPFADWAKEETPEASPRVVSGLAEITNSIIGESSKRA